MERYVQRLYREGDSVMIQRYHEAPIDIFDHVQERTDGDYALVHLFADNREYYKKFEEAIAKGRDVILDNSLFELGVAFDPDSYMYWIKRLKPTWVIVPDSWKNSKETIKMFFDFINKYPEVTEYSKLIGVAQGTTPEDTAETYKAIEPYCSKIAFNLDFSSYCCDTGYELLTKFQRMSLGRIRVLRELDKAGVINRDKPHHLLGCGVPNEIISYASREFLWIQSIDTSNPIMAGMHEVKYTPDSVKHKIENKMCDHMNDKISLDQRYYIDYNMELMKGWCQRNWIL